MKLSTKQSALHAAEVFDSWRVIPRLFLGTWSVFTIWFITVVSFWYMHLPANERGTQESGLLWGIITTLVGFTKLIFETYSRSGRDWTSPAIATTQTSVTSTTTAPAVGS